MEKKKAILLQQSAETVVSWLIIKEHQVCHSICGANVSEPPPHHPLLLTLITLIKLTLYARVFALQNHTIQRTVSALMSKKAAREEPERQSENEK